MENFEIAKGDLYMGDRAYGTLKGIGKVADGGGAYIFRLRSRAFNLYADESLSEKINMKTRLESLKCGRAGEFICYAGYSADTVYPVRICVLKKNAEERDKSLNRLYADSLRKGRKPGADTKFLSGFVMCATNLNSAEITAEEVMKLYRYRWQIENAFKRLKSLLDIGRIPNQREDTARAWMYGKMLLCLLIEAVLEEGRLFSPWGYRAFGSGGAKGSEQVA